MQIRIGKSQIFAESQIGGGSPSFSMPERPVTPTPDTTLTDDASHASGAAAVPFGPVAGPGSSGRGWLKAGAVAPRPNRRLIVRVLVALTGSTAILAVAGFVAAAAIVPPIGARRNARMAAEREVETQLAPGERVEQSAYASQRRWTDVWRESYGIVVATDRRLLYVGAPPTPLLRPIEDGPAELLVESYPYDAAFTLDPRTLFRGYGRGLVLRMPLREVDFIVDDAEWNKALAVSKASVVARSAVTRGVEELEASNRSSAPRPAVYVTYVVQRGETLIGLARRFRTSPDVLRQLNQLQSDAIRSGQRLRVPGVPGVNAPLPNSSAGDARR